MKELFDYDVKGLGEKLGTKAHRIYLTIRERGRKDMSTTVG